VVSFIPWSLYVQERIAVPTRWVTGLTSESAVTIWRIEKSIAPYRIEIPDLQARSLVAIQTTICWIFM